MYKPDRDRGQTLKSSRPVSRRWTPMTTLSPRPYMDRFDMIFTKIKTIITIGNLQVVRFAVYVYFTLSLIASQEVSKDPYTFVPIFLILKVDLI